MFSIDLLGGQKVVVSNLKEDRAEELKVETAVVDEEVMRHGTFGKVEDRTYSVAVGT